MLAHALALVIPHVLAQDPPALTPSLHDRIVTLEITASDPVFEGHGHGVTVEHSTTWRGTLHVWTRVDGDFDTFLRVDANGTKRFEDDDGGGKPTPYKCLSVGPGTKLVFTVMAAQPGGTGRVELHMRAAPETEGTLAAAKQASEELAAIRKLREEGDAESATERATALGERLLAIPDGATSAELDDVRFAAQAECYRLGLLQPTERVRRLVVQHHEHMLPSTHLNLLMAQTNLATSLRALGRPQEGRDLLERVLAAATRTLGEGDQVLQGTLLNLAVAKTDCGDLQGARVLAEQLVAIRTRLLPPEDERLLRARNKLASTLNELGDLEVARLQQEQILEVCSRTLEADNKTLLTAQTNLANTLNALGDLVRARDLKQHVLAIESCSPATTPIDLGISKLNLAATLHVLGDDTAARALLESALVALEGVVPPTHQIVLRLQQNLSLVHSAGGDLEAARKLMEQALAGLVATLPEASIDGARARLNLGNILRQLGQTDLARPLVEVALAVLEAARTEGHPELQSARENMGAVLQDQGDLDGSRALFEKVLAARLRILPEEHTDVQTARLNLARTIVSESRFVLDKGGGEAGIAKVRRRYGELVATTARALQRNLQLAIRSSSSRAAEEICARLAGHPDHVLSFAAGYGVFISDPALERAALAIVETARGAALASARFQHLAQRDPRYHERRQQLAAASTELARIAQGSGDPEQFRATVARRDQAEQELSQLAGGASESTGNIAIDLDAVAARLGPREAVVVYRRYVRRVLPPEARNDTKTDSMCAHVLRAGGKLQRFELGELAAIEKATRAWRDLLGAPLDRGRPGEAAADRSQWLYATGDALRRLIVDPLLPAIDDAERLVLLPDDVLHTIPIDALPLPHPAAANAERRLCGERWTMQTQLSLHAPAPSVPRAEVPVLLALGGAAFNSEPLPPDADESKAAAATATSPAGAAILRGGPWERGFEPLPSTTAEARGLAVLAQEAFGESVRALVLDGCRASRESVVRLAPRARWLHLATHGWFAPESIRSWSSTKATDVPLAGEQRIRGMSPMLLCGLAFAGANLPADSTGRYKGLVTAEEIAGWDLSSCELAVLSACDTNVGDRRAGQGVASLQKALHMAGARTAITSLWKVPDEATKDLMLDFYRRVWIERKPKHEALWAAKQRLRNAVDERGKPRYTPRDWAGWVLTGAPD